MRLTLPALALCAILGPAGHASAQSIGAPAGRDPATAPGGTDGLAGPRNAQEAIRSGDAVPAPPGIGEPVPPPADAPPREEAPAPRP